MPHTFVMLGVVDSIHILSSEKSQAIGTSLSFREPQHEAKRHQCRSNVDHMIPSRIVLAQRRNNRVSVRLSSTVEHHQKSTENTYLPTKPVPGEQHVQRYLI